MRKIWDILYPLLFYYAVMLITMTIAQWIFGSDDAHYVLCRLLSTVVTIPFVMPLYREAQMLAGKDPNPFKIPVHKAEEAGKGAQQNLLLRALIIVAIVACLGISLNNLISMTPLVEISTGYQEANAAFYGSTLILELISSALLTPIIEELVFRGIIFTRLRRDLPKLPAVVLSALIFAMVHWNIVQFLYALLLGLALALLMEREDHLYAAVLGHITANLIAVVRTETGFLAWTVQGDVLSWAVSVAFLIAGVVGLYLFCIRSVYND
jgi:hypothetical protein